VRKDGIGEGSMEYGVVGGKERSVGGRARWKIFPNEKLERT
jgi:hypothetical protein